MKRAIKPILFLCITLAIVVAVGAQVRRTLTKPPAPPRTVAVRLGEIVVKVTEAGIIEPVNKVDVRSKVAGRLLTIPIEEGQFVTKGQLIATVDRTLIDPQIARMQAQLEEAEARLQQAKANYSLQKQQSAMAVIQAQANLRTAEARLTAVQAPARVQEVAQQEQSVARAEISLEDAQRARKRKEALLAKGFIAQAESDAAQTAVETAESTLAAAKQQLALVKAGPRPEDVASARTQVDATKVEVASARVGALQIEVRKSDITAAQSSVRQIRNDLAQLMVQLGDTRIVAPASAIVLKKYKEPNEIVQSATTGFSDTQSLVATLGSTPVVRVGINEVDIAKVRLNSPVDIKVDALPDAVLHGHVAEIAPASTNSFPAGGAGQGGISKFSVKVAFDHPDGRLRPGMTANVEITASRHAGVVLAPLEGVPFTGKRGTVTVLVGKKPEKRQVVLGQRNDTEAEAVFGLKAGELLVVDAGAKDRRTINIGNGPD